ncbi:MAG: glycosyltransferase family 4 protein [Methylocystis sp.]|nr:glycosyltransferase family 4 protein [Methylocystis sp.]
MKILLFANTDWYIYNFRRTLAAALRDAGHDVLLVSPPGAYGERLRDLGFRWIPAPMNRGSLNPFHELALLGWLWRLLLREQPTVVHSFTIKCSVYGGLLGRLTGTSSINAVAGMGYVFTSHTLKARLLRPAVRLMLSIALGGKRSKLILQNPDDMLFFETEIFGSSPQVYLIKGSGVDCSLFLPPQIEESCSNRPVRVLLASRILWDKGVAEFIEAARMLRSEQRSLEFLLAGDPDPGNPAAVPLPTLMDWQAEGLVQWLGHVADMPKLLANVDVVVLPSYREGLPKSLIEAAACARPLIATDVPGCREVVTDGVEGFLIPPRDAEALARSIAKLQDNALLARSMGMAARRKALGEFDERIVIKQTMDVYDELAR